MHKKLQKPQYVLKTVLSLLALMIFIPVWMIFTAAFTEEAKISMNGFAFWPAKWSTSSFEYVIKSFGSQMVDAYQVTIFVTISATIITLLFTSMLSYVISRKELQLRRGLTVYLLITMIFSGGVLGSYLINTNIFNMRNNLLVLILPGSIGAMNCFIIRSFIVSNVPDAIIESAKIDGANEYVIFFRVVLPLLLPVMGAIGFMVAIGHWNEWENSMLYIKQRELHTLQQILMEIEMNLDYLAQAENLSVEETLLLAEIPTESGRMALLLIALLPVLVIYPFFQRYFVKGLSLGSVK